MKIVSLLSNAVDLGCCCCCCLSKPNLSVIWIDCTKSISSWLGLLLGVAAVSRLVRRRNCCCWLRKRCCSSSSCCVCCSWLLCTVPANVAMGRKSAKTQKRKKRRAKISKIIKKKIHEENIINHCGGYHFLFVIFFSSFFFLTFTICYCYCYRYCNIALVCNDRW